MDKTIKIATDTIAGEIRSLSVGEVVRFPVPKYKISSVLSAVGATLADLRAEGRRWKTKRDSEYRFIDVTRTA